MTTPEFTSSHEETNPRQQILSKIMTTEEYSKLRHNTPYVFEVTSGKKSLYYFGSRHSRNPSDEMFKKIEAAFNQTSPDIAFVEGIASKNAKQSINEQVRGFSREEVIEKMGEPGFTIKLAVEKGIDWQSPEPSDSELYTYLLEQGNSREDIFAWEVFHILPQYHRHMTKHGFAEYAQPFIERFKHETNWQDFDYSYEHAIAVGEAHLGRTIDVEHESQSPSFTDPIPWDDRKEKWTMLNKISQDSNVYRDRVIVSSILDGAETHKKIFVVYGGSHAVMQEPALKEIFKH